MSFAKRLRKERAAHRRAQVTIKLVGKIQRISEAERIGQSLAARLELPNPHNLLSVALATYCEVHGRPLTAVETQATRFWDLNDVAEETAMP